ncbi:MAG: CPBP family glutamic-type intramembrane protease, partial [Methylobacter sp.]
IYYGQTKELLLIAFAGVIFGTIFIHTGSIVFTAIVHGLYDSILCLNLAPFRLNNGIATPILFLVMLAFLIVIIQKPVAAQRIRLDCASDSEPQSEPVVGQAR